MAFDTNSTDLARGREKPAAGLENGRKPMNDMQDPLERAHDAALDAETARGKAEQAYEQAVAEETYFYGVQVWMGGRWIMMLTSNHGTSLMHRGKWFEHKHEAQACAAKWNHDTPTRIVRQRRSPMEVCECG